ncbi:MAG TPA: serine hydrolase [Candidatus Synoicihabitans sp.]|nr:serine hydrolase [Candidatus Synoicihabitans sp.]
MNLRFVRFTRTIALALVIVFLRPPAQAAAPSLADSAGVQRFFDELLAEMMRREAVPGAAITLVKDGRVLHRAGYGWADEARRVPVEPGRTVFPFGSVSKILTSIAVLQQVEQRRLDLDADITLAVGSLPIDRRFAAPVRLRHLLAHTDGFDVRWLIGGATTDPAALVPLHVWLQRVPPRILPPNELYLYSDVGITLAGYAVERATGQPFADYLDEHVLGPLEMTRATFQQPLPPALLADRATGYEDIYDGRGTNRALPIAYPQAMPASGLNATVDDLANLMIALLHQGERDDRRILQPDSVQRMFAREFSHHPDIPGVSYGFYEYIHDGHRGLMHGGLMLGFTSMIFLLPEQKLGLCVVINKFGLVSLLEQELIERFLREYFPPAVPPGPSPLPLAAPALPLVSPAVYDGVYRCDQYSRRSADKIGLLTDWASEIRVRAEADGRLTFGPDGSTWRQIAPLLFENERTRERVAFQLDPQGRAIRIVGSAQFMSYHRVRLLADPSNQGLLALGFLAAILASAVVALVGAVRDRSFYDETPTRWIRSLRIGVALNAALIIAFLGVGFLLLRSVDFAAAFTGRVPLLPLIIWLPVAIVGVALTVFTLALVNQPTTPFRDRWAAAISSLGSLGFGGLFAYWNLFPWWSSL